MSKKYLSLSESIIEYNLSNKIITTDIQAYISYPKFNFVYDKLFISSTQRIPCAPMGVYPKEFPVIFKPIYNLYGMSRSMYKINTFEEYDKYIQDGLFWQNYFPGPQTNIDIVYNRGEILFYSALKSIPDKQGSFLLHSTYKNYELSNRIICWLNNYLGEYRGCINLEVIDNNIIEAHLRLNGDFNLYNKDFCLKLSEFYNGNDEIFDYSVPELYMFPIFIERDKIESFNKKKEEIKTILDTSDLVSKYYFDNMESMYQSHLLRAAMIESYHPDCIKLKQYINKLIE